MNKAEFIDYIAKHHGDTKKNAEISLNRILASLTSALAEGEEVLLIGFGKFSTRKVPSRQGLNPQTKKMINIPARVQVSFKSGQTLKDACNK